MKIQTQEQENKLAFARRRLRGVPAKSTMGKASRVRVESTKNELTEFASAVRCMRLSVPRLLGNAGGKAVR